MSPVRMRWSVLGVVPAALAGTAVAAFIGLNEMEQQQAQQTAQETEEISQEEQQLVNEQNAFDESMTAGNN